MTTTFVLVHGAWHGNWAWDRVSPLLELAGARVVAPDLDPDGDAGLRTHVEQVLAAVDAIPIGDLVLVGHSYAGLVVRQAADLRPERVRHIVLVEGWAGANGASMLTLAPDWFGDAVRSAARSDGNGRQIPAPAPELFGVTDPADARWLAQRLRPHPLRTFIEPTSLGGAVDRIPGTGICCRPEVFPFARFAGQVGYPTAFLDGPHDVMLTDPRALTDLLLAVVGADPAPES